MDLPIGAKFSKNGEQFLVIRKLQVDCLKEHKGPIYEHSQNIIVTSTLLTTLSEEGPFIHSYKSLECRALSDGTIWFLETMYKIQTIAEYLEDFKVQQKQAEQHSSAQSSDACAEKEQADKTNLSSTCQPK